MKIGWLEGSHNISFDKANTWFCLGVRGAGKSAFLEHLAELHLEAGNAVLDLFGARSGENLGWLRSKWAKEKRILLLSAENAIVETPTKLSVEVKPYAKISLSDFSNYDIIINSSPLYPNLDSEFEAVNTIISILWQRLKWSRLVFVLCREAANLLYARMKITENQTLAKTFVSYWLREARHTGTSLALDSQRFMAVDVDVRSLIDFLVFKSLGAGGLPRDLHYMYRYINPPWMQRMKPFQFAILSRRGDIGVGTFPLVDWHVKEGEGIVYQLGLKVQFEEAPEKGESRGTFQTLGDREHAQIIALYVNEHLGMKVIAARLSRSSYTVKDHVDKHNAAVEKMGYCPRCRRVKSPLDAVLAQRL
ncbi:MAG: hypothetical protein ACQXXG_09520 [Candidatus Bathyarchaeia archaeon]|nr:hypothetical protein [Candidatus Bathyarchaeota archaeon]